MHCMSRDWRTGELEELFADLARSRRQAGTRRGFVPAADVFRTDDPPAVTVVVDLAGVDAADVELAFSDGALVVSGLRRRTHAGPALYQQMELDYGPFERRIAVGEDVDSTGAEAVYDRGLLTVRLPVVPRPPSPVRVVIAVVRRP
jgi:HSP20 family protein